MKLNTIFQFMVPKDRTFYPLFEQVSSNLLLLAETLHEGVNHPAKQREEYFKTVDALKKEIELLAQTIRIELGKNFITPFDREDIHFLSSAMDDVADFMNEAASRMRLYQVDKITKSIRKLTAVNLEKCEHISKAIKELKNMKNMPAVSDCCNEIYKLEAKADKIFDKAVADIFENETNVKDIIKYKEVLSSLETASDRCKKVAKVLETITVKYS